MNLLTQIETECIHGPAGQLEIAIELPKNNAPIGIALVAHPHPLFHGTMHNKIVTRLCKTLTKLGYVAGRLNFRGVGKSEGTFDHGQGETQDVLALHTHMQQCYGALPVVLAGFSFGSFVQTEVQKHIQAKRLVLVGPAVSRFNVGEVPKDTIIIHGELDETVPLSDVFNWLRPQDIPVHVVVGADHFFHRKLHHIDRIVTEAFLAETYSHLV